MVGGKLQPHSAAGDRHGEMESWIEPGSGFFRRL